jgi:hypothetical protein
MVIVSQRVKKVQNKSQTFQRQLPFFKIFLNHHDPEGEMLISVTRGL